jgi:hypothetical protein
LDERINLVGVRECRDERVIEHPVALFTARRRRLWFAFLIYPQTCVYLVLIGRVKVWGRNREGNTTHPCARENYRVNRGERESETVDPLSHAVHIWIDVYVLIRTDEWTLTIRQRYAAG